jgi:membrane protease YdiL (CAAX protease family)
MAWTLLHWGYSWQGLTSVFLAGILMTWLVWRTGSIWVPIAAHAIVNLAALVFTYVFSPY